MAQSKKHEFKTTHLEKPKEEIKGSDLGGETKAVEKEIIKDAKDAKNVKDLKDVKDVKEIKKVNVKDVKNIRKKNPYI